MFFRRIGPDREGAFYGYGAGRAGDVFSGSVAGFGIGIIQLPAGAPDDEV